MRARPFLASCLSCGLALFALFGCTAILGNFEVGAESGGMDAGQAEASPPPADADDDGDGGERLRALTAKLVTAGERHTCALDESGDIYCWGDNADGQLGLPPDVLRSPRPTKVDLPVGVSSADVVKLVAGAYHTCAVTKHFKAYCWGRNACGQLGGGTTSRSETPHAVVAHATGDIDKLQWTEIAPGRDHTCATEAGGQVYCWGCNGHFAAGEIPVNDSTAEATNAGADKGNGTAIGARSARTCMLQNGNVVCWGTETDGEFGNSDEPTDTTQVAQQAKLGVPPSSLALGESHTCTMTADQKVICWGSNKFGQLGIEDEPGPVVAPPADKPVPLDVVSEVTAGGTFTCAIQAHDKGVFCLGSNVQGELGRGGAPDPTAGATVTHPKPAPVVLPGHAGGQLKARAISAGLDHACAVMLDTSEVVCWGNGTDGQLGDGTVGGAPRTTPVFVQMPAVVETP